MKWTKLTALLATAFFFLGCDKEDTEFETSYVRTGLPVTAGQNVPNLPTPGSGTMDVTYNREAKTLTYTVTWTNLTDSVIAIRINGPGPQGYISPNLAFTGANPTAPGTTPHAVIQETVGTATKALFPKSGTYTGTLLVDEVKVKESQLMDGKYYLTIHTKTIIPPPATAPNNLAYRWFGEIRGQILIRI